VSNHGPYGRGYSMPRLRRYRANGGTIHEIAQTHKISGVTETLP